MAQVITFADFTPPERFDAIPWTSVQIEEGALSTGPFTLIDTQPISPVDADPAHPSPRSFTTELATDTEALWYRLIFLDATGDDTLPTTPIQNVETRDPYASVDELARILKIRDPSAAQTASMRRALIAAAGEIDSEIDLATSMLLTGWQYALASEVNLERAVEHWRQQESPFGLTGLGGDLGAVFTSKDSWERHALKLAPLKSQWGLA